MRADYKSARAGSETKTAKKLHQGIRTNHNGETYPVNDPKSTK